MEIQDFCITQILHKINFLDIEVQNLPIQKHLEALNFFMNFCTFGRLKLTKLANSGLLRLPKKAVLEFLDSPNLISRKI